MSEDLERREWESESVPVLVSRGQSAYTYQPGDAVTQTNTWLWRPAITIGRYACEEEQTLD